MKNKMILTIALIAASIATAQAEKPENSPFMNEISTYDAIFLQNVSNFVKSKIEIDIVKVNNPAFQTFNEKMMEISGLDEAARVHLNRISLKSLEKGYELRFNFIKPASEYLI